MGNPSGRNSIDIIEPYVNAVTEAHMPPVQLLGGVGSVALTETATTVDTEGRTLYAPADLYLAQYRPEGTLRDIETLVLSADPSDSAAVQACAEQHIGDDLVVETFAVKDASRIEDLVTKPFGMGAVMTFVSDRYTDPLDADAGMTKSLFPFEATIDPALLEPWKLHVEGRDVTIPVPPVGTVVLNYLTRSISGARPKDAEKLQKMAGAIFGKAPDTVEWIIDGPGREQFELARVLHTLREPKRRPRTLTIGDKLELRALDYDALREHPAFLLRDEDETTQLKALRLARMKARLLHTAEARLSFLVGPFQKYVEPRIKTILHNDVGSKKKV